MKTLFSLVICLVVCQICLAQKDSLAFDDHGKYIYYKTVSLSTVKADSIYNRVTAFFNTAYDKNTLKLIKADAATTSFTGSGYFLVAKKGIIARHDDGQIAYALKIEIKDNKYRYWLTNFVYTPFFKDRYSNFVPQKAIEIPLEKAAKKLDVKDVDHYLDESAAFAKRMGDKLKTYVEKRPVAKKDTTKKVISINKW